MRHLIVLGALLALAMPAVAQDEISAPCARREVERGGPSVQNFCYAAAQAMESAQPQLGVLLAGGNPTLGTASTGGLRLGVLPRVSATARLNLVFVRLPDILAEQAGETAQRLNSAVGLPAPALSGTVAIGVFPGVSVAPMVGGIGAIDLLGSASWLPLKPLGVEGFQEETDDLAFGGGARLGLLRESFVTPGVSVSVMYRNLGRVEFGEACASPTITSEDTSGGYRFERGHCAQPRDPGEIGFDLSNVSTRVAASKRLLGVGLTAGFGHDRFVSDIGYAFRAPSSVVIADNYYRVSELDLEAGRWSAFLNGSFTVLAATLAVEAGWLQGGDAVPGFDTAASEFDPKSGTFFGSVGARLAF